MGMEFVQYERRLYEFCPEILVIQIKFALPRRKDIAGTAGSVQRAFTLLCKPILH
jgi:hypothetical protein